MKSWIVFEPDGAISLRGVGSSLRAGFLLVEHIIALYSIQLGERPLLAKEPGYMLSTPAPVFIDRLRPAGLRAYAPEGGLDWDDVVSCDGPFSDGNEQHTHCIAERAQGYWPKIYPVKSFNV